MPVSLTPVEEILAEVAAAATFDTEYDGRTYCFCKYCEANMEDGDCEDDCLSLKAREALGEKWLQMQREARAAELEVSREQKQLDRWDNQRRRRQEKLNRRVKCDLCDKTVAAQGIPEHQKSESCAKRAKRKLLDEALQAQSVVMITQ